MAVKGFVDGEIKELTAEQLKILAAWDGEQVLRDFVARALKEVYREAFYSPLSANDFVSEWGIYS